MVVVQHDSVAKQTQNSGRGLASTPTALALTDVNAFQINDLQSGLTKYSILSKRVVPLQMPDEEGKVNLS